MAVEKKIDVYQPERKTFPASPEFSKAAYIKSRKDYDEHRMRDNKLT